MPVQHRAHHAAAPAPGPPSRRATRIRRTLLAGGIATGLGIIAMIIGIAAFGTPASPGSFQRVNVSDGNGTITFSHADDYVAYYESSSITKLADQPEAVTASRVPLIPVRLTSQATGHTLVPDIPYGHRADHKPAELHYDYVGRGAPGCGSSTSASPGSTRPS